MISRYSRPEMAALWSEEEKQKIWLEIELLALEGMEREDLVPPGTAAQARAKGRTNPIRAQQIEDEVKHDVIAFLTSIAESIGPEARFMHRGMTSNDLLDTALAVQCKRAGEIIIAGIDALLKALLTRANEFRYTPCIGRSHGIHAEPTTFGIKLISFYAELQRRRAAVVDAVTLVSCGKIAGAVGTFASVSPAVEAHVMAALGLTAEAVPSQIVHRDRHAQLFTSLALLGSSIERMAVEFRHLQRTEVGEVEEGFSAGQKGSSAMPHKKNPISTENISGLARLLRSYAQAALENIPLWHERDISHSSVERVIGPDACILTDYMLHRMKGVVQNLVVHPDRMVVNLEQTKGLVFSGTLLIALADSGMSREDAYRVVQQHALACWEGGASFRERVAGDPMIIAQISASKLDEVFSLKRHIAHADFIFERALAEAQKAA